MKISQKIITNLKSGGANFFLSVPCKLLANMITILENDKDIYYSGRTAESHTRKMVNNMKAKGINVLSYFISEYRDDCDSFTNMYGKDAEFINATNMMQVAKTMNKKFLSK